MIGSPQPCCTRRQFGSPKFPGYPFKCMLRSKTPVVSLLLAKTQQELLPSAITMTSAFAVDFSKAILKPQLRKFRGSISQPTILIHPASDSRYRAYPRISLLAWWLTFSQVGLSQYAITHWVTLLNFILRLAEIPTIWAFLAQ